MILAMHWTFGILFKVLSFVAGVTSSSNSSSIGFSGAWSNETFGQDNFGSSASHKSADLNDRAMRHPLCSTNTSAYVGQTARMYCCLARLHRDLSVSKDPYYTINFIAKNRVWVQLYYVQGDVGRYIYFYFGQNLVKTLTLFTFYVCNVVISQVFDNIEKISAKSWLCLHFMTVLMWFRKFLATWPVV